MRLVWRMKQKLNRMADNVIREVLICAAIIGGICALLAVALLDRRQHAMRVKT